MPVKQAQIASTVLLVIALCLLPGCNRDDTSSVRAQGSGTNPSAVSTADSTGEPSAPNRCSLLTDDEIRDAIGPHDAGVSELMNLWGLQSCRWVATAVQKGGWKDSIEVALFRKDRESWAREQATGDPVNGFVEGALYDSSNGELWFNCAHDRFCVVKASLASGKKHEQVARQVAQLVEKRLR